MKRQNNKNRNYSHRDYDTKANKNKRSHRKQSPSKREIEELSDHGAIGVINRGDENIDRMLNRFKRKVKNSELLIKYHHKKFYKKPSFIKRLKKNEAKREQRKRDRINDLFNKI